MGESAIGSAIGHQIKEFEQRSKKEGFEAWLSQDVTRFMMSMIPQSENKEVLLTLVRNAYESGFHSGCGAVAAHLLAESLKKR